VDRQTLSFGVGRKLKPYRGLTRIFADNEVHSVHSSLLNESIRATAGDAQLTAVPAMRNLIPASLEELPVTAILASAL